MMQEWFASTYELVHGLQDTPLYADAIYPQMGAMLLISALAAAGIYYYVIGWRSARFVMLRHWTVALILNSIASMAIAWVVGWSLFGAWAIPGPMLRLVFIQGLYAAAAFALMSVLVKWGSRNARRTPF